MLRVWPIFKNLNKNSSWWFRDKELLSVDEVMIPYCSRYSAKQYIRGKPIRYSYKVMQCALYCGSHTNVLDVKLEQGLNVVLDLVQKAQLVVKFTLITFSQPSPSWTNSPRWALMGLAQSGRTACIGCPLLPRRTC